MDLNSNRREVDNRTSECHSERWSRMMHWPPFRIAPLESGFPSEDPPPCSAQRLIMPPSDDQLDFHPATLRQPPEPISYGAKNRLYAVLNVATSGIVYKRGAGWLPS